jgi:hypothetical protein
MHERASLDAFGAEGIQLIIILKLYEIESRIL